MNEKIFKKKDKPEELIRAEKLINEHKFVETLKIINDIEKKGDLPPTSQNKSVILKSNYLYGVGRYKDSSSQVSNSSFHLVRLRVSSILNQKIY